MRLYTVQPKEVWEQIKSGQDFICDKKKSEYLDETDISNRGFINGYNWLVKQMNKKIQNPDKIEYPIWAWYKREGINEYPDLNGLGLGYNEPCVMIELEVPDEEVLLSDFDLWHCVLNDSYIYDEKLTDWDNDILIPINEDKEKSWEEIFNVETAKYIQATFWKISRDMVISAEEFFPNNVDLCVELESIEESGIDNELIEFIKKDFILSPEKWAENYLKNEIKTKQMRSGYKESDIASLDSLIEQNSASKETVEKINKLFSYLKIKSIEISQTK